MCIEDAVRLDDVPQPLAHFASAAVQDQAQADDVPVSHVVLEEGGEGVQAVEPAPGLVHGFADVVRRQPTVGLDVAVLERVVPLGKRHHARVEPTVHYLRNPPKYARAIGGRAGPGDVVHIRPVQVQVIEIAAASLGQFLHAADTVRLSAPVALPDGNGSPPVPFPGDGPVHVVAQPFPEPSLSDVLGVPVDPGVVPDQTVFDRGGPDVPGRLGVIEEWRVATPAERVGVAVYALVVQEAARFQVGQDFRVGVLDELAGEGVVAGDDALQVDGLHERKLVLASEAQVLVTKSRRDVNDPAAVVHAHEVGRHHLG